MDDWNKISEWLMKMYFKFVVILFIDVYMVENNFGKLKDRD